MSRIGKKEIIIPIGVHIVLISNKIIVEGNYGQLELYFSNLLNINIENNLIYIKRNENNKKSREYHGLIRALIQNMVIGVSTLYKRTLVAEGVGYKFHLEKKLLTLYVGFTHPICFNISSEILIKLESATQILITGISKEKVNLFASQVRAARPPEPYKGKGILYAGEKVIRKIGKTARSGK